MPNTEIEKKRKAGRPPLLMPEPIPDTPEGEFVKEFGYYPM